MQMLAEQRQLSEMEAITEHLLEIVELQRRASAENEKTLGRIEVLRLSIEKLAKETAE